MSYRLLALALLATGCQTYDFEPLTPVTLAGTTYVEARYATNLKPNIMLLVDKSGSMELPLDPTDAACPAGCGSASPCPSTCATRISELRSAMSTFLSGTGSRARLGLTYFPTDSQCGAPTSAARQPEVSLPPPSTTDLVSDPVLVANAATITASINTVKPMGGTPTAASLSFVGALPALTDQQDGRDDLVLLLTDGLPNCNAANPNNVCTAPNPACRCTLATCATGYCSQGCLDEDATVAQIRDLRVNKRIKTAVLGFGAETNTGDAPAVLQAMGAEGGFRPRCPAGTDAECGAGNSCNVATHLCQRTYFQARNRAELERALNEIVQPPPSNVCEFSLLDTPSNEAWIAVIVDGVDVPRTAGIWSYDSATNRVIFANSSAVCDRLRKSTSLTPVPVTIRFVQQL